MYKVDRLKHEEYGRVIEITRVELGEFETPFQAVNRATRLRRLWLEEKPGKVRVLVDSQVMILKQAESWANEEYKSLPKCEECAKILTETVFTHQYCGTHLFCSEECSDNNFNYIVSLRDEEEECDL